MQIDKKPAIRRLADELGEYAGIPGVVLISPQGGIPSGFTIGQELQMPVELLFDIQSPLKDQVVIVVQDEITNGYILGRVIEGLRGQEPAKVVVAALAATRKAAAVLSYAADETVLLEIVEGNKITHSDPVPDWLLT